MKNTHGPFQDYSDSCLSAKSPDVALRDMRQTAVTLPDAERKPAPTEWNAGFARGHAEGYGDAVEDIKNRLVFLRKDALGADLDCIEYIIDDLDADGHVTGRPRPIRANVPISSEDVNMMLGYCAAQPCACVARAPGSCIPCKAKAACKRMDDAAAKRRQLRHDVSIKISVEK
jgi:hypothetical protein